MVDDFRGSESASVEYMANAMSAGEATVRNRIGKELEDENLFVADTGYFSVSDQWSALFENPTSDKIAVVFAVAVLSDSQGTSELLHNPTNNLPTTARAVETLAFGSGATSNMNIYADTASNAMTGGETGIIVPFESGHKVRDYYATVYPGQSIGVSADSGTLGSFTVNLSLFFYEVSV